MWWLFGLCALLSSALVIAAVMRSGQVSRSLERWWRDD